MAKYHHTIESYIEETLSSISNNIENSTLLFNYLDLTILDLMTAKDLLKYVNLKYQESILFIISMLFSNLKNGSLWLNLDSNNVFIKIPDNLKFYANYLLNFFLKYFDLGYYNTIIGDEKMKETKPIIMDISLECRKLYFQKYYFYQRIIKQRIGFLINKQIKNSSKVLENVNSIIEEIYSLPMVIRDNQHLPIKKDLFQVMAIRKASLSYFSVISGGPGTGKTSLLTNIIRVLLRIGVDVSKIFIGAPTGRAASRITDSLHSNILSIDKLNQIDSKILNLSGSTLHKILESNSDGFMYGKYYKLPASILILDEVSMIDVILMGNILEALDVSKVKLLLLGDKDQLPSIEAGSVFSDIIGWNKHVTMLKNVYRFNGSLVNLSIDVNLGKNINVKSIKIKDALNILKGEWAFVTHKKGDEFRRDIKLWSSYHYFNADRFSLVEIIVKIKALLVNCSDINKNNEVKKLFHSLFKITEQAIILTFVKEGETGSYNVNKQISEYIKLRTNPNYSNRNNLFDGAIIMVTRNDYSKSLFNGDIGIVINSKTNNESYVYFKRLDNYIFFNIESIIEWNFAFATTIHKSQGLGFKDVMILFPDSYDCRLLKRETLYTGITRASSRVILYGTKPILNYAIGKRIKRDNGYLL